MVLVLVQGTSECMCGTGQHGSREELTLMGKLLMTILAILCRYRLMALL
jgi:hypothetical protein